MRPTNLSFAQRAEVFDTTVAKVIKYYFDPNFNGIGWPGLARENRSKILSMVDSEAFELAVHDLVRSLGTSHTGFFHQSVKRVPARLAIGATFGKAEAKNGPVWEVRDIHEGGPAHAAGLRPLDRLNAIDGTPVTPPHQPMFPMGAESTLIIERSSEELTLTMKISNPRSRTQPYAEMKAVAFSILDNNVGYLKVTLFPGFLGLDVARAIDSAIFKLFDCDHLVLDLRGHLGGGLGVLRLMSYLTPDHLPIGFTLTRKLAEKGYDKDKLRRLDRLPTTLPNPLAIASMAMKYVGRDESVLLVSEGLGAQKWHGSIVILINEHTVSAGEMVAAFARENDLATLIGVQTAGRLIPGSGFKVGHGYMLTMPKAAYITWSGDRFEGEGVKPHVLVPWSGEQINAGSGDTQLHAALSHLVKANTSAELNEG